MLSTGGGDRPPAVPARLVVALGTLASFGPLSIDVYLPALPEVGDDLDASAGAVALTVTACTVGLGLGQLLVGPLSDRYGRRRPLLIGVTLFTLASVACALAPSLPLLVTARFLQALGGSAGIVLSRAIARDLRSGEQLTRLLALLLAVNGLAPVLAPLLGGQLLRVTSWRGSFVALALIGLVLFAVALGVVPESLPAARRRPGGPRAVVGAYRTLLGDRKFVAVTMCSAMAFGALFCYIAASPFVLQDVYGLSPQTFSLVFAASSVCLILGARLAVRVPLVVGLGILVLGSVTVLLAGVTGLGLAPVLLGFALITSSIGLTGPPLIALALHAHGERAGSASALVGASQFVIGGLVAAVGSRGASGGVLVLGTSLVLTSVAALLLGVKASSGAQLPSG